MNIKIYSPLLKFSYRVEKVRKINKNKLNMNEEQEKRDAERKMHLKQERFLDTFEKELTDSHAPKSYVKKTSAKTW